MGKKAVIMFIFALFLASLVDAGAQSQVDSTIAKLGEASSGLIIRDWRYMPNDAPGAEKPDFDDSAWKTGSPEFEWGREPLAWLRKAIVIPESIGGMPVTGSKVVFCASVDDDGECWVNGVLKQQFHWDECRVTLTENAQPGEKFVIVIKGINTGGPGRLLSASLEYSALNDIREQMALFAADLEASKFVISTETDASKQESFRKALDAAVGVIDMSALEMGDKQAFTASISAARKELVPISKTAKEYVVHLIGHAHIDMNWLWLWPETVDVCRNTFNSVLKIMDEYPEFRFGQSQPSTYVAIEKDYPDLFARIQKKVKSGQWEITGGTWTEGDMNMASGESIVRQILYAKQYFEEKFGAWTEMCWEPDTFGHAWTIPQILAKSGLKYYYFCRCGKNEPVFWWEGPDGSRVLAYNRGWYNEKVTDEASGAPIDVEKRDGVKHGMIVYGVGDHGGGPTRNDIAKALELQKRDVYATVKFDTTNGFYGTLLDEKKNWPVIRDELNFIFQGCYTTHSDVKRWNRVSENLLPAAETFSVLAEPYGFLYPKQGFVEAWRNTCFNQFHDIFDGSAIHGSYDYSRKLFDKIYGFGDNTLKRSLDVIVDKVDATGNGIPVVVFNPLSWKRTDVVRMPVPDALKGKPIAYRDAQGKDVPTSVIDGKVIFTAKDVPSLGYKVFHLSEYQPFSTEGLSNGVENEFFQVEVDPSTGAVIDIYDKKADRHILSKGQQGDMLQFLHEAAHGMSAWNIGQVTKTENATFESVQVISQAPVSILRIKHKYNKSSFTQDIILYPGVRRIDFKMTADWQEIGTGDGGGTMLKVAFPVDIADGKATFEIPFGSIERLTNGQEVPALKWIDVSNKEYGVSLLNDCKYGHDVNGNTMRLTLLRCSDDPDPRPDQGTHEITYSLYPHTGDWKKADTVRRGYELNNPLIPVVAQTHTGRLPKEHSFLQVEPSNIIVTGFKKAEDSDDLILRFYESQGIVGTATINLGSGIKTVREANLMEKPISADISVRNGKVKIPFGKWEIKTLRITTGN